MTIYNSYVIIMLNMNYNDDFIKEKTAENLPQITLSALSSAIGDIVLYKGVEDSMGRKKWIKVETYDTKSFEEALSFFAKFPGAASDPNWITDMSATDMIKNDIPFTFFMFKQSPCDTKAMQILLERSYGKVADKVELSGEIKGLNSLVEKAEKERMQTQITQSIPSVFLSSNIIDIDN